MCNENTVCMYILTKKDLEQQNGLRNISKFKKKINVLFY